jgi:hypothetical protein
MSALLGGFDYLNGREIYVISRVAAMKAEPVRLGYLSAE